MADITNKEFRDSLLVPLKEVQKFSHDEAKPHMQKIEKWFEEIVPNIKTLNDNVAAILTELKTQSSKSGSSGGDPNAPKDKPTVMDKANTAANKIPGLDDATVAKAGQHAGEQAAKGFGKALKTGSALAGIFEFFVSIGNHFNPLDQLWKGLLKDEWDYQLGMREIAFQTQGITGDMKDLQNEFKALNNSVSQTGQSLTKFQKQWMNNLQKGIGTTRQELMNVTKTQMNLSTMIGDKDNAIAETFRDWHVSMGMTNIQLAEVSRGIQETARSSGLTGKALTDVVNKTGEFVKRMRDAGTLTAGATKQVTELLAQAQKLGATQTVDKILKATTDSYDLLFSTDQKTQSFLYQAAARQGKTMDLLNGTLTSSREGTKAIAKGMEQTVLSITGGKSMEDIKKMNPAQMAALNRTLQSAFGISVGEYMKTHEAMVNSSKSFGEKIEDINIKLKDQNTTEKEKQKLLADRGKLIENEGLSFMTKFSEEAGKVGTSLEESANSALKAMGKEGEENIRGLAKEMNMAVGPTISGLDAMRVSAAATAKSLKAAGGKDFTAAIEKAIGSGDMKAMKSIMEEMNEEQQKQGVKAAKGVDPTLKIQQKVDEIEGDLRTWLRPIQPLLVSMLAYGGLTIGILGQMATLGKGLSKGISSLGSFFFKPKPAAFIAKETEIAAKVEAKVAQTVMGAGSKDAGSAAGSAASNAAGGMGGKAAGSMFKMPEFNWGNMKSAGLNMLKGAAAMAVFVVGVVALMAVLMFAAKQILGLAGITPMEAIKLALTIAAIIGAAGLIAVEVLIAAAALEALGLAAPEMLAAAPEIALGAVALLAMTFVMVLLAAAIIGMAMALSALGFDLKAAAMAAVSLAAILGAAALISIEILAATVAFAVLGALATLGLVFAALAALGVVALLVLLPVMIGLAAVIIKFGEYFAAIAPDPAAAAQAALVLAEVLGAAALIALAVVAGASVLGVLGAMCLVAWVMAAVAALGTVALMVLLPVMVGLAAVIIKFAEMFAAIAPDPAAGVAAANTLASVLGSAAYIAATIVGMSWVMGALGAMSLITWIMIPFMVAGGLALLALSVPLLALSATIVGMAEAFTAVCDPKKASVTAEGLASVFKSAAAIADSIDKQKDLFLKYTPGWWSSQKKLVDNIWAGGDALMDLADPVLYFSGAVVRMASGFVKLVNPKKAAIAAEGLASIMKSGADIAASIDKQKDLFLKYNLWDAIKLIPKIWSGGMALELLSAPVLRFTKAIVQMAVAFTHTASGGIRPSQAAAAAEGLARIMQAGVDIAKAIEQEKDLFLKYNLWDAVKLIPKIWAGATALKLLADPVSRYAVEIAKMAVKFTHTASGGVRPNQAAAAAEGLARIMQSGVKIAEAIDQEKEFFLKYTPGFWNGDVRTLIPNMQAGADALLDMAEPIVGYVKSIGEFAVRILSVVEPGDITKALAVLRNVGKFSKAIEGAIQNMQNSLGRRVMISLGGIMTSIFGSVVDFFPKSSEIEEALKVMTTTVAALANLSKMIDEMQTISDKLRGKKLEGSFGNNVRQMIFEASYVKSALKAADDADSLTDSFVDRTKDRSKKITSNIYDSSTEQAGASLKASEKAKADVSRDVNKAAANTASWTAKLGQSIMGMASSVVNAPMNFVKWLTGTGEEKETKTKTARTTNAVSATTAPATPVAQTAPSIPNVERVKRDNASVQAGTKTAQGSGVGKLENLNSEQIALLKRVADGIDALVASFQLDNSLPQNGMGSGGGTYDESLPSLGMTESPTWANGAFEQHPATGILTRNS